jgi:hypothetical protein
LTRRQTDPRIKWIPYYDNVTDLVGWNPTEWDKWPAKNRASVERFVKDEPHEVPGKTFVRWDLYDTLRARLAPDPRRDWIIV